MCEFNRSAPNGTLQMLPERHNFSCDSCEKYEPENKLKQTRKMSFPNIMALTQYKSS